MLEKLQQLMIDWFLACNPAAISDREISAHALEFKKQYDIYTQDC
jgi:hypothetical protein